MIEKRDPYTAGHQQRVALLATAIAEELGFTQGSMTYPERVMPEMASSCAGAPRCVHYANRYNRILPGDMDFVNIPATIDAESLIYGGRTPLALKVELLDAKNHWYCEDKI